MPDKENKGFKIPKRKLYAAAIGIVALLVFWFGLRTALAVDNPFYVVPSESMVPTLNVGDVVVIRNGPDFTFDDVKVGDIIVFHTDDGGGRTIVHRVVEIYYYDLQNGDRLLKTKGDNNPQSYEGFDYPIEKKDYYGKVISIIPKIGLLSTTLRQ
jgi:signal peptidase